MPFISVDVEASGPVPGIYDLLSLGAVLVDHFEQNGKERYHATRHDFYIEIKPFYGGVDPEAMAVNRLDLEHLRSNGASLHLAAASLIDWLEPWTTREDPAVFVGYCANFDWAFVNDMFIRARIDNPFGYKALDIRSLAMGILQLPWFALKQDRILPQLGLAPLSEALAHNALADARHQAEMFCALLNRTTMVEALHH